MPAESEIRDGKMKLSTYNMPVINRAQPNAIMKESFFKSSNNDSKVTAL